MSLRIRRGTDAERMTKYYDQGELIWTTDYNRLYVGDSTPGTTDGTQGGVNILTNSVLTGAGLSFNVEQDALQFNILESTSLKTQLVNEEQTTTYVADGSNGNIIKVDNSLGIVAGMMVFHGLDFVGTVASVSLADSFTVTLTGSPGGDLTDGNTLVFKSTNLYFTAPRAVGAIVDALDNGTQTGLSYTSTSSSISFTTNVLPNYTTSDLDAWAASQQPPEFGTLVYDTTLNVFKGYKDGSPPSWVILG
jgi:hypothetical protein